MTTLKIISSMSAQGQKQVTSEVIELLKAKYGPSLNIEITDEELQAFTAVSKATQDEINQVGL